MSLNVGELFVSLGVKGTEKTVQAFTQIKTGISGVASTSLEAKAAIIGVLYGLEQLMSSSGQVGTNLINLNALLGISTKTLQQYEYAGRQVKISNQEMDASFSQLKAKMTDNIFHGTNAGQLSYIASKVGLDQNRKTDTEYVFQKMQEFARTQPKEIVRSILSPFVGDNVITGMLRNAFSPNILKRAPTYSEGELHSLDRANIAWSNLNTKIEMAVGRFNAMHGNQLVNDISKLIPKVIELTESFVKLAETMKAFQWLGKIFEGWGLIFSTISKAQNGDFNDLFFGKAYNENKLKNHSNSSEDFYDFLFNKSNKQNQLFTPALPNAPSAGYEHFNNTINQYMNFYGSTTPDSVREHAKSGAQKGITNAQRQQPQNVRK